MYVAVLCFLLLTVPIVLLARRLYPDMSEYHTVVVRGGRRAFVRRCDLKTLLSSASEARGAQYFSMCAGCHTAGKNEVNGAGPNLWGIVLRRVAASPSFRYSPALSKLSASR